MAIAFTWPGGKTKALAMSYDDGCIQDRKLIGIFDRYGIKGTFHLNSGLAGNYTSGLTPEELRALYAGHEISCHTLTHPFPERIARSDMMREIWLDRENLERITGEQVRGLSYPMRTYTPETVEICRAAGMLYARTAEATRKFNLPADFMLWAPTCHHREALEHLESFRKLEAWRKLSLFLVWGHGFEFERENSGITWEKIETFCREAAALPDVWFGTCMEICRYVNAVRGAEVSCDGKSVYNPAAVTLFLEHNREIMTIAPGETLRLK